MCYVVFNISLFNSKRLRDFDRFTFKNPCMDVNLIVCLFICLFVPQVAPQFIEIPDKVVKVIGNSVASLTCRVSGFPPPTIVWSRGLVPLPQGRTTVSNDGTLSISKSSPGDAGPYQCKATNKLGSVSALTTLNYVQPGEFTMKIVLKTVLIFEYRQL